MIAPFVRRRFYAFSGKVPNAPISRCRFTRCEAHHRLAAPGGPIIRMVSLPDFVTYAMSALRQALP